MRHSKPLIALLMAALPVMQCHASEKDELALVMRQLDQVQAGLDRARVVANQNQDVRFYFDYQQATHDIAAMRQGIATYMGAASCTFVRLRALPCRGTGMAMNDSQVSGWSAGTGSGLTPAQLNILILGTLAVIMLLFSAWALVHAYRGLPTKAVTFRQFNELLIRLIVLWLLTLFLFFH